MPTKRHPTKKVAKPLTRLPMGKHFEFDPHELGVTLMTDEKTLKELEDMQGDAVKAAQKMRKFAWR